MPLRRSSTLARRLLLLQVVTVLVTVGGAAALAVLGAQRLETDAVARLTTATAQSVASDPVVVAAVAQGGDPFVVSRTLQPLALRVQAATGSTFVVVMSLDGVRYSHAEPDRIGAVYVGSTAEARAGQVHSEHFLGTLGQSLRTIVPVWSDGRVIGMVSVGILEGRISQLVWRELPWIIGVAAVAVAVGAVLAWLLARRVRRQTLGLEPDEIAAAYTHHDAVLHAVREGLMVLDAQGRVVVLNAEARRLLGFGLDQPVEGCRLVDLGVDPALRAVTRLAASGSDGGTEDVRDALTLAGERVLVLSRTAAGPRAGDGTRVVTLRDRTELAELLRERDAARDHARALASQAHEFANRMQTVLTLVQLGDTDDALRAGTAAVDRARGPDVLVQDPVLAALLMDKAWTADERGIAFSVTDETTRDAPVEADDLVSLVGNLVDNALDAAAESTGSTGARPAVSVHVHEGPGWTVEVSDTGPGIPAEAADDVFTHGYSTKPAAADRPRGIGLALVARIVARLDGTLQVLDRAPGTTFALTLPTAPTGGPPATPPPPRPSAPSASAVPPPPA